MRVGLPIAGKIWILVLVPFAVQVAFVCVLAGLLNQVEVERQIEMRARDKEEALNSYLRMLASTARDLGHNRPPQEDRAETPWTKLPHPALARIHLWTNALDVYRRGDSSLEEIYAKLAVKFVTFRDDRLEMFADVERGDLLSAAKKLTLLKHELTNMLLELNQLLAEQQSIEESQQKEQKLYRTRIEWLLVAGVTLNILLAASFALALNKRIARRLEILMNDTLRFVRGEKLSAEIGGSDEIARLDRSFRQMADSVAATNRRELAVVANAADIICCLDRDGNLTIVNPALTDICGYLPQELLGHQLTQIVDGQDADRVRTIISDARNQSDISFESGIRHKDNSLSEILWSGKWSPQDETLYCIGRDVTKRNELERLKRELVVMVSHDLRTPMTSVKMFLSLASNSAYGELKPQEEETVAVAERNLDQLNALVENVLDMEKIESGKLELSRKAVKVRTIVETALESVSSLCGRSSIDICLSSKTEASLWVDPDRLTRALSILLSCAITFSEAGSSIIIETAEENATVTFRVTDQSTKIPDELVAHVFDRFIGATESVSWHDPATRIGLAICKAIVEQHGGKVSIEPNQGAGNTFWLSVPMEFVEEDLVR